MFPLGTVLVPHEVLPLQVFEPRYRTMVERCLATDRRFGVVLIERGSEVGGGEARLSAATVAVIEDCRTLPDGRLGLMAVGRERCRVTTWLPDDPYPRAEVDLLAPDAAVRDPAGRAAAIREAWTALVDAVRVAGSLDDDVRIPSPAADPVTAAWQVAAWAPVTPLDVYTILDEDDPERRIDLVLEALAAATEVAGFGR